MREPSGDTAKVRSVRPANTENLNRAGSGSFVDGLVVQASV